MDDAATESLWAAGKRGAWLGLKWTTSILGPVAVLMQLVSLAFLGSELARAGFAEMTRERLAPLAFGPLGFYLSSCLWACTAGFAIVCLAHLVGKLRSPEPRTRNHKPPASGRTSDIWPLALLGYGIVGLTVIVLTFSFRGQLQAWGLMEYMGPDSTVSMLSGLFLLFGVIGFIVCMAQLICGNRTLASYKLAALAVFLAGLLWLGVSW